MNFGLMPEVVKPTRPDFVQTAMQNPGCSACGGNAHLSNNKAGLLETILPSSVHSRGEARRLVSVDGRHECARNGCGMLLRVQVWYASCA